MVGYGCGYVWWNVDIDGEMCMFMMEGGCVWWDVDVDDVMMTLMVGC